MKQPNTCVVGETSYRSSCSGHWRSGATGQGGTDHLLEAVSLAQENGMLRVVQDTHPDLIKWERMLQGETVPLLATTSTPAPVPRPESTPSSVSPSRLLTPKEREVLQLLARNLSNKQIALALNVGEETVKWHLKNLFGKLSRLAPDSM